MKIGLCSVPPAGHPASLLCMMNSTAMSGLFNDIIKQFDKLYKKKVLEKTIIFILQYSIRFDQIILKSLNLNCRLMFITIYKWNTLTIKILRKVEKK